MLFASLCSQTTFHLSGEVSLTCSQQSPEAHLHGLQSNLRGTQDVNGASLS